MDRRKFLATSSTILSFLSLPLNGGLILENPFMSGGNTVDTSFDVDSIYQYKLKFLLKNKKLRFDEVVLFNDISDLQDERVVYTDTRDHVSSYYLDAYFFLGTINSF